jgi:hypothetical protein
MDLFGKSYLAYSNLPISQWEVLDAKPTTSAAGWDRRILRVAYAAGDGVGNLPRYFEQRLSEDWKGGSYHPDETGRWYVDKAELTRSQGPIAEATIDLVGVAYVRDIEIETPLTGYLTTPLKIMTRRGGTTTQDLPGIYSSDVTDPDFDSSGRPVDLLRATPTLVFETIRHGGPRTVAVGQRKSNDYQPGERFEFPSGTWRTTSWLPEPPDDPIEGTPYAPIYKYPFGYYLAAQDWEMYGDPISELEGDEGSLAWPRFNNCLSYVRDTWVYRRMVEPGPET